MQNLNTSQIQTLNLTLNKTQHCRASEMSHICVSPTQTYSVNPRNHFLTKKNNTHTHKTQLHDVGGALKTTTKKQTISFSLHVSPELRVNNVAFNSR